jgi:hypothetical protein
VIAVTTRSHVRALRFFPGMLVATMRIRRQLERTPGVVRWASVIGGPREFWTLTVWRSLHEMQEFMRSDAHGDLMWLFSRWLDSFWLARWRPGPREVGSWSGVTLAHRGAASTGERRARVELPFLRDSMDETGRITYETSSLVRRSRERLSGIAGGAVRLAVPLRSLPRALRELRRLRRLLESQEGTLRLVVGAGRPAELYLFAVWRADSDAAHAFAAWTDEGWRRWGARLWAQEWLPENEFGHWDGLRLRAAARRVTQRPRAARDAEVEPRSGAPPPSRARARRPSAS